MSVGSVLLPGSPWAAATAESLEEDQGTGDPAFLG